MKFFSFSIFHSELLIKDWAGLGHLRKVGYYKFFFLLVYFFQILFYYYLSRRQFSRRLLLRSCVLSRCLHRLLERFFFCALSFVYFTVKARISTQLFDIHVFVGMTGLRSYTHGLLLIVTEIMLFIILVVTWPWRWRLVLLRFLGRWCLRSKVYLKAFSLLKFPMDEKGK